jgi:hypothetical protein
MRIFRRRSEASPGALRAVDRNGCKNFRKNQHVKGETASRRAVSGIARSPIAANCLADLAARSAVLRRRWATARCKKVRALDMLIFSEKRLAVAIDGFL